MKKLPIRNISFVDSALSIDVLFSNKKVIKTSSRNSTITPFMIDKIFQVHNGRFFFPFTVTKEMLKHKLGEFFLTRVRHIYKKKN